MSAVEAFLSNEKALALRLVRTQSSPHDFWLWLSGLSATPLDNVAMWVDSNVCSSIKAIIDPNLTDADLHERSQANEADAWIAAILGFVNKRALELKLNCGQTMMAASLLPLYRSLATRKLPEALEQTRHRLAEMLVLVGITQELGEDFLSLLHLRGAPIASPYSILKSALKFDLVSAGSLSRRVARAYDPGADFFDPAVLNQPTSDSKGANREVPWSEPQLLWKIAGELTAKKADIVLPRQWADIAIPWTAISDHWNALTHRLSNCSPVEIYEEGIAYTVDDEIVSDMIDDVLAMQTDMADVSIEEPASDSEFDTAAPENFDRASSSPSNTPSNTPSSGPSSNSPMSGRAHASHGPSVGAPRMDSDSEADSDDAEEYPETDILEEQNIPSVPKIAVVEIASQTDKVFLNIIRLQIGTARNEDRTLCLMAACVKSDDESDRAIMGPTRANGLAVWQEKLVNWLADHPHVHDPFAFVTADGQLVVSMLDIERSEATNIVREGLVTVLTGKRVDDQGALARVAIPARYYGGIGSVTAPNASFAAEQLISAAWRCLSAAQSQGKATIKSIEVY